MKTSDATVTVAESLNFKCNNCNTTFKTERCLNIHNGMLHKNPYLKTPEKSSLTVMLRGLQ